MRMMNPIQSVKNQLSTVTSILASTLQQDFVATATEQGVATKVTGREVPVGAHVYSMDISVNYVTGGGAQTGTLEWVLMKTREGQSVVGLITSPNWTDIGLSNGRNQVIKSYQAVYGTDDSGAIRYNIHIKIPKSFQRMRSGDNFVIAFIADDAGTLMTGARYKYYQ